MIHLSFAGKIIVNILLIIIAIVVGSLIFVIPFLKKRKETTLKDFISQNKLLFASAIALIVGFISRVAFLNLFPGGLNQDEASAGYDAYAILTTGMDRNGVKMPIHLIAWGSGQNALYTYLCIPFMMLFGVNEISLRLPMGVVGCVSIFLLFKLLKDKFSLKTALYGTIFLIICPWHFMKSRWGLESNLFPDLVFLGFYLLMLGLKKQKLWILLTSSFVLGLSAYSYGTSYFFLFFFVIATLCYLFFKKSIKWWHALSYLAVIAVVSIPIMIFIYINMKDKETVRFLCFTIPKLTQNRFKAVTNIYSDNFFKTAGENFKAGVELLLSQNDHLPWNSIARIGTIYFVTTPFVFLGLFRRDKENSEMFWIMRIWFIVAAMMMFLVSPNVNRINIIYFPMIFFAIFGIIEVAELSAHLNKVLIALYSICFVCFLTSYFGEANKTVKSNFFYSFGDAIECAESVENVNNYYVTSNVNMPYIFVLYYTEYDVKDFIDTAVIPSPDAQFRRVSSFGNYYFYLPSYIQQGNVYIVSYSNDVYKDYDLTNFKVTRFENYYVIDATE